MAQLDGLAAEHRAAVEHCRAQMAVHIAAIVVAQGFAETTKAWASGKGIGKNHGLFYTAAQSTVDAAVETVAALREAETKLEVLSKALYDMGA